MTVHHRGPLVTLHGIGAMSAELFQEQYVAEAYIRQAPLPKGNDPHEWAGWPLFEAYGLAGDGRPCSTRGKNNG